MRLYLNVEFSTGAEICLSDEQIHYLHNVMRKSEGERVRVFNGRDGEWLGALQGLGKRSGSVILSEQIVAQPEEKRTVSLLFAPIRKQRLDVLIEKSVELGVSDLFPVITAHTENRNIKRERIMAQIVEAAEQCERMSIPELHPSESLDALLRTWKGPTLRAALEREILPNLSISELTGDCAFLVGPEGGFDEREVELLLTSSRVTPISLGDTILRAETAGLYCLSLARCAKNISKI